MKHRGERPRHWRSYDVIAAVAGVDISDLREIVDDAPANKEWRAVDICGIVGSLLVVLSMTFMAVAAAVIILWDEDRIMGAIPPGLPWWKILARAGLCGLSGSVLVQIFINTVEARLRPNSKKKFFRLNVPLPLAVLLLTVTALKVLLMVIGAS